MHIPILGSLELANNNFYFLIIPKKCFYTVGYLQLFCNLTYILSNDLSK